MSSSPTWSRSEGFRVVPESTLTGSEVTETTIEIELSVASLAGTYADAPFMEDFSEFLQQYRNKINRLNEE